MSSVSVGCFVASRIFLSRPTVSRGVPFVAAAAAAAAATTVATAAATAATAAATATTAMALILV